jgi:proteic killer suppression protein
MIGSFKNRATEDIFNGVNSKAARKLCPSSLWRVASRKLDLLDSVTLLDQLRIPPGNMLEALQGDRQGAYSIRINSAVSNLFCLAGGSVLGGGNC